MRALPSPGNGNSGLGCEGLWSSRRSRCEAHRWESEIPFLGFLFLALGKRMAECAIALGAPRTFIAELFVSKREARPSTRAVAAALRGRLLTVATTSVVPNSAELDG